MSNTSLYQRISAPIFAVLIALAIAACSSDTRAVLAPSDAQLTLSANGPIISSQQVEMTVAAMKSDGSPVDDGTEIQLTASNGELQPSKVRTQGGQATTVYTAGLAGPVQFRAASDVVSTEVVLYTLSSAPANVSLNLSAEFLPPGGGELDVTATVTGGSGERVVGAPVEFLTTHGSFGVSGPATTNEQGQATARLSSSQATEVKARVYSIESNPVKILTMKPLGKGDQPDLPFRMSEVRWLHENVGEWDVTSEITDIRIDHDSICIEHTKAGRWPRRNGGEGNPWVFANIDGTWYAATYEYLRSGQICKHITRRGEWGIGPHTKRPPLEGWVPRRGELVGFMVSTFARDSTRTSNQRSNVVMVEWPY